MNFRKSEIGGLLVGVVFLSLAVAAFAQGAGAGAEAAIGPGKVVVRTALGGFILGYDIDPDGTTGILSEALTLPDGRHDVAVETFDQRTGEIIDIVSQQSDSKNGFVTLGIFGGVALTEFEHSRGLFVDKRTYALSDPADSNRFTGTWTPPFSGPRNIITGTASSAGSPVGAFLAFRNRADDFASYVFSSNVGANTFGPVIRIPNPLFDTNNSPVMAFNATTNQAVLGSSKGCFGCPTEIGMADLATGQWTQFRGRGFGFVNGIAIDSQTNIACTTTEDDFSVEFYDLTNGTSRIVKLPGAVQQSQSGGAVAVDEVNRLFLVGQEFTSTALQGSSIQVFDEQGNFVESLNGFRLPASPAYMALNPARRTGFVIVTPDLSSLQSFRY